MAILSIKDAIRLEIGMQHEDCQNDDVKKCYEMTRKKEKKKRKLIVYNGILEV